MGMTQHELKGYIVLMFIMYLKCCRLDDMGCGGLQACAVDTDGGICGFLPVWCCVPRARLGSIQADYRCK
jgi:hypothetical protein